MTAAQLPIEIEQGSNFSLVVFLVGGPTDLTGYTGAMQIRTMKSDPTTLYDVPSGQISIDSVARQVSVDLRADGTAAFDWDHGVYDVRIVKGSDAYRVVEGKVTVDHWVTRS
jgi:hypothetical protein